MEITIFLELLFISAVRQKGRKEQCLIQDLSKFNFEYEFTWFFDQSSFFFYFDSMKTMERFISEESVDFSYIEVGTLSVDRNH